MQGKSVWNKRVEMRGQKRDPKLRGQRKSLKESSFLSLYFFFSLWFFFSLFSLEKKKMIGESVWNKKVKAGAKSERVKWEFEGKLPPFSWFFLLFYCVFCLLCVWEEENDDIVLSSSSMVVLQKRRRQWQCAILFFCGIVVAKKAMAACCHCLLLWWCSSKEDNDNLLPLPSFLC